MSTAEYTEEEAAHLRAFRHYLRTGERLTTAQYKAKYERKFNPYHDPENGRFTFAPGGSSRELRRPKEQSPKPIVIAGARQVPNHPPSPAPTRGVTTYPPGSPLAQSQAVTADHIRVVMPAAKQQADRYVKPLNKAMEYYQIDTPEKKAAFLAQVFQESKQLQAVEENLRFSAEQLTRLFPSRFPSIEIARKYVGNPEAIANRAYAGKNGNGDESSGDGYRYRGRGLMMVTGRGNYTALGYEDNPDALFDPYHAAFSAAGYWKMRGLNERTKTELSPEQFGVIIGRVNKARLGSDLRWQAYLHALAVLRPKKREK